MTKAKTMTLGGKEIPLTKSGLPNRVHLTKEQREVVGIYADKIKKDKKEVMLKELADQLSKLK